MGPPGRSDDCADDGVIALASQSLSIAIALIPYVRETFRRHLSATQAVMLVEFDKLKRDYQEHQHEIQDKLVVIMGDRLAVHCRSLQVRLATRDMMPALTARVVPGDQMGRAGGRIGAERVHGTACQRDGDPAQGVDQVPGDADGGGSSFRFWT